MKTSIQNMNEAYDPKIHFFMGPQIHVEKFVGKLVHNKVAMITA